MKTNIFISFLCVVMMISCNDGFMERFPETSISPEAFFKTTKDLELYTNTYYTAITPYWFDYVSDNCAAYSESHNNNSLIRGSVSPDRVSGWDKTVWGVLRKYNLFLANLGNVSGDAATINHYIGLTRLMRADWYYSMVKLYSDVPWYSKPLTDTDEELLYKSRDPRTLVVDSIMADLQFAVNNMSEDYGNRTKLSRWYAAALMARICLHEGTFRKYHDELNLQSTASTFLQKAVEAAEIVINSGKFSIDKSGGADAAYRNLFTGYALSSSPEILLFKDYDSNAQIFHGAGTQTFNWATNLSRSLMESYQYITPEGRAVPFSTIEGYEHKSFIEVFENRDPRFKQTFMPPGFTVPGQSQPFRPSLNFGGYPIIKYICSDPLQYGNWSNSYTDLPVCRYAEVLLVYAEAKAELGSITQSDMDKSINMIRGRVDLPPTIIGEIIEDPALKAQFPGISDNVLLEIRRERRIELVSENFRWDDLMRWKAGHLVEQVQQGIYIDKFGLFDITGDGKPDMGVFADRASNTVPEDERSNYSFYYVEDGAIELSNNSSGYIIIKNEVGKRTFLQPKYYYWPVPQTQTLLNPNLKQTIYWE